MKFTIEIDQASRHTLEALAGLGDALAQIPSKRQNFIELGNSIRAGFAWNFEHERAGDLYPWADLAKSTQTERALLGYPAKHPILERSGEYRESFTNQAHEYHVATFEVGSWGFLIEIGSRDPRVATLEFGDDELIPARAVTVLSSEATDHLERTMHDLILATLEDSL